MAEPFIMAKWVMTDRDQTDLRGISVRAMAIGFVGATIAVLWTTHSQYVAHSAAVNFSHFPLACLCLFLFTVLLFNLLGWMFGKRFSLSPLELLTILAMNLIASVVPVRGLIGWLLPVVASPFYFATPENGWASYLHDHIASWIAPRNTGNAMGYFFEGAPPGVEVSYGIWALPLFWWLTFVVAVFVVSVCVTVILRKQWVENENLNYPIVGVGIEIANRSRTDGFLPPFVFDKPFKFGFAASLCLAVWQITTYFAPGLPSPPLLTEKWFTIAPGFPPFRVMASIFTLGFCFFANLEVLFSVWFFFIVFMVQNYAFNRLGLTLGTEADPWSAYGIVGWQSGGAFTLMVLWVLFVARKHLMGVLKKAAGIVGGVDDSDEMMRYRAATLGAIIGLGFMVLWLRAAGMQLLPAVVFVAMTLILYVGVARIIVDTGIPYIAGPLTAQSAVIYTFGAGALSPGDLTTMAFTYAIIARNSGLFMSALAHIAKMADSARRDPSLNRTVDVWNHQRGRFVWAVLLAAMAGVVVGLVYTLYLGYEYGAYNFNEWAFGVGSPSFFDRAASFIRAPFATNWNKVGMFCVGGTAFIALNFARYRLPWWPLHPIGLTVSSTFAIRAVVLCVFVVWGVKLLIIKIGGPNLYHRSKPFAVGLIIGWVAGVTASYLVDIVWFPGQGHPIHIY